MLRLLALADGIGDRETERGHLSSIHARLLIDGTVVNDVFRFLCPEPVIDGEFAGEAVAHEGLEPRGVQHMVVVTLAVGRPAL